jgi:hypothetical protein
LLGVSLSLAACGPERRESGSARLAEETVRIAHEFARSGDAGRARADLQALDVANPLQWLVYLAETAISGDVDAEETADLVRLAIALGSQSRPILDYAISLGIIEGDSVAESSAGAGAAEQPADTEVQPAALPTVAVVALEPTPTPEPVLLEPTPEPAALEPTPAPLAGPRAVALGALNVRSGPGTVYPIVEALDAGEEAEIVGRNAQADWWQVSDAAGRVGWVFGELVAATGDVGSVSVAANIPEPPPTVMPAPAAEAPPVEPPAEDPAPAPADEPPAENPAPPADGPEFVVIEKRLWDVYENGGFLSGPTVTCGEKHELIVNVVDANGSRLNGVAVQSDFNAQEIFVTGAQGKGDGVVEFVLWSGQDVKVVRDADGREVASEVARGMTTRTPDIPFEHLIAGQYCTDEESCRKFATPDGAAPGCWGHFSWTVTFQRKY